MTTMTLNVLRNSIEKLFSKPDQIEYSRADFEIFNQFKSALNKGTIRIAEKRGTRWVVNPWVKKGVLLGFRIGKFKDYSLNENFRFFDKSSYPLKNFSLADNIRLVPGGSSIRDGCYISPGVICMPPMYINVGTYIGSGTMIDSHSLVGSCAQIGERVHISAGAQIGGVLEPIGSLPVIIENDVLIGGNCSVFEGVIVREKAVLAAGTNVTASTPIYDIVNEEIYRKKGDSPLEVPANAVVVPGTRMINEGWGKKIGLSINTPIIVKYRDERTDDAVELEDYLR